MQQIGVYNDNLSEPTFLAGLRHSMDTGVLPKPPVQIRTVEVQAQPSATEVEAQKRAAQDEASRRRYAKEVADSANSGRIDHSAKSDDSNKPSATSIIKNLQQTAIEQRAKRDCETLRIYRPNGREDRVKSAELQKIRAFNTDNSVNWLQTWKLMQSAIDGHSAVERNRLNNR
jgi:hypothetical protein